jgi:hypothetical protein
MKILLVYEDYVAKFYNHDPMGRARVPNEITPLQLYFKLASDGYSKNLYVCEEVPTKNKSCKK